MEDIDLYDTLHSQNGVIFCAFHLLYDTHLKKKRNSSINTMISRKNMYRKTSSISRIKSQNLNVSNLILQLSLLNPFKIGVKSRMKM